MKSNVLMLVSIILGVIIGLITGFIPYPTLSLIGTLKWGYPFYWLSKALSPSATIKIEWTSLVLDILIWVLISFLLTNLAKIIIKKSKNK